MNIANLGAFGAGLVRGNQMASEERRQEEDQAFQNEQRKVWRDEQARQERIRQGIASLVRPGEELRREQVMAPGIDGEEAIPGNYNIVRQTDNGYYGGLGDIYAREGLIKEATDMRQLGRTLGQQNAADAALATRKKMIDEYRADPQGFMNRHVDLFNGDAFGGPEHKGKTIAMASTPQGQVAHMFGADGKHIGTLPVNEQTVMGVIDRLTDADLATVSPEMFNQAQTRGIHRTTADAAMKQAVTMEGYRRDQANKPIVHTDGQGRIVTLDSTGTKQLGVFGSARPDTNGSMHANIATVQVPITDPTTGKVTKMPIQVSRQMVNGAPVIKAYDLSGKPITDPKVINAAMGGGQDAQANLSPTVQHIDAIMQELHGNKTMDPMEKLAQIQKLTKMRNIEVLRPQVASLSQQERVPELRKLVGAGMFTPEELNKEFGFSYSEIKEAQKPEALSQPKAPAKSGGSATTAAAPAQVSGGKFTDQQIKDAARQNGVMGVGTALLGPRPAGGRGNMSRQREWDAQEQELLTRLQSNGGLGLKRQ